MGLVPFAGNDPIFYLHHANIDRLWECWTTRYGRGSNPVNNDDWMKKTFAFVDEKGEPVTMNVAELFDPKGRIDYTYDNVTKCFRVEPKPEKIVVATEDSNRKLIAPLTNTEVGTASNVLVNKIDQQVPLAPSPKANAEEARKALRFAVRPSAVSPSKAFLTLVGVQVDKIPGSSVKVYLTDAKGERRAFVGVLSFFGLFAHKHDKKHASEGRDFSFDVSDQLQQLLGGAPDAESVRVALVASTGLTGDDGVNQAGYEAAGLRIREIKLEVETAPAPLKPE